MEVNTYCSYTFNLYRYEPYKVINETFVHKIAKYTLLEGIFTYIGYVPTFVYDFNYASLLDYDVIVIVGTPYHRLPAVFTTDINNLPLNDTISPIVYSADAFRTVCDCLQKPFIFVPFVFSNWIKENKDYYSTDLYRITSARGLKKELQGFGLTNQSKVLVLILSYTTGVNKKALDRTVNTVISICEEL